MSIEEEQKNKVFKNLELQKIKKLVENYYGFRLNFKTRPRTLINALKVYTQLSRIRMHSYHSIAKSVDKHHATIIHHYKSFNTIDLYDLNIYNSCLDIIKDEDFGYDISEYSMIDKKKDRNIIHLNEKVEKLENKLKEFKTSTHLLSLFSGWTESQQHDFIENRLKPYSKLISQQNLMIA